MNEQNAAAHGSVCPWWLMYFADYRLRSLFQPTGAVIDPWVKPGDACLDMGCGMGYFTLPLAHRVGAHGKVTAVDLQPKMLEGAARRAHREGVAERITLCRADEPGWRVPRAFDFILAFWMLHEVPGREQLLKELHAVLKPGGRFLLVEPKIHVGRRDWELSMELAETAGFRLLDHPPVRYSRAAVFTP